jgi:hypothetical protein
MISGEQLDAAQRPGCFLGFPVGVCARVIGVSLSAASPARCVLEKGATS